MGTDDDFALARYRNDGCLDTSFGVEGKVTTDISNVYLMNINFCCSSYVVPRLTAFNSNFNPTTIPAPPKQCYR
jgi:hypothetical protein